MKQVSPKDWQALSAYLDGQLSQPQREKLEARLQQDKVLQDSLLELKQTKYLLQQAKVLKAPRNFTLSPEMAGEIKTIRKPFAIPLLSFSSIAAALLLVVLILVEFNPLSRKPMLASEAPVANTLMMESAPAMDQRAMDTTENPPIISWGIPGQGGGGGGDTAYGLGGGPAAESALPGVGGAVGAPEENPMPESPKEPSGGGGEVPQTPPESELATAEENAEPIMGAGPILGVRPEKEAETYNQAVLDILGEQETVIQSQPQTASSTLRFLQIGLGLIALGTAIAAIWLNRRASL